MGLAPDPVFRSRSETVKKTPAGAGGAPTGAVLPVKTISAGVR